ncbi:glycosyltransferase family 1 protein [Cohnella endophytica]|uniref:Glycosyltransferase family 1 protein n=1 Tax=Cohnella endophytica TaxID=2419778 RepID=A0A494XT79_9BACL|nr:glycosyltransferase [Cohnella endophytica]RKP53841.1 glycosyltransferase family 1 protein [Cohnella endophytica]
MSRILHLSEYTKGGIETHLNEVLKYQSDNHDIYLLVSEFNSDRDSLRISPERLLMYPYKRKPSYFLKAMSSIRKTVKEIDPDIVHVHGTFAGLFLRTLFLFKRKRPVVVYCSHGWSFLMDTVPWKRRLYAWIEKAMSLRTDVIIHISQHEYEMAMRYGLSAKKSVVVYNGVSDAAVQADAIPFVVRADKINLLFVGRFDRQKGFDLLLEVFNEHRFEDVRLYLAGDSVLQQRDYAYPDNAVKLGWIRNSDIDRYMSACDAVIVPSRWEGFGIVAIEALRNKKPVIASNRGALPEIVEHGVNGYVFDFDDKEELAGIVKSLDKVKLAQMGQAGGRIFEAKFHSDRMNKQIERLYEATVDNPGGTFSAEAKNYV